MKKKHINFKKLSLIITGVISVFLIIFALTYSLSTRFTQNNNEQISLNQKPQNEIKSQADVSDSNSLNDVNIGGRNQTGTSLSNTPIILSDGSYLVTTNSGLAKVSPFGTILYSYSFVNLPANIYTDSFSNYKSRQVVQNYLDPSLFYLLIYSPDVSITVNPTGVANPSGTGWKNPGYVLTLKDNGNDFALLNSVALLLPTSGTPLLSKVIFSPTLIGPETSDSDITSIFTSGESAPTLNDKWTDPGANKRAPGINYALNVIDNLYLNNLNNMVFINGSLFIFGGNDLPNFWFWSFSTATTDKVNAKLYLNVGVTWPSGIIYAPPQILDPTSGTSNSFLKIKDGGTGTRADPNSSYYYPAYFVAGAKTVAQNRYVNGQVVSTSYSIQAMFVLPGYLDILKGGVYPSAFLNASYVRIYNSKVADTYYSRKAYYLLLSMNSATANNFVNGPQITPPRKLFDQSNYGISSFSLNFSSIVHPDGYINNFIDKMYGFDIQTIPPISGNGLDSVNALMFSRDEFSRIIYDPTTLLPVTAPNSSLGSGNLVKGYSFHLTSKNEINQSNAQQIVFTKNAWYILINNSTTSLVVGVNLAGSYVPVVNNNQILPPSSISLSFESISAPQGSDINGLLPVSDNFIYALTQDQTTKNVSVNLFKRNSTSSPYAIDNAYVYKPTLPTYANNSSIWGTITVKDNNYLNNAGYFSNTASEIANDSQKLQNIINFVPAWPGQVAKVAAPTTITDQTQLPITINVEYFNHKMYNNQSFKDSLGFPDTTLTGLSSLPSWVIPVAVGVSIGLAAIILILGLAIGIPMGKNRKLQDKGFAHTFKKVDTLTSAVGSVYKKIITETSTIKKKPQMLKSASPKATAKPAAAPNKPVAPINKPSTPPPPIKKATVQKPKPPAAPQQKA